MPIGGTVLSAWRNAKTHQKVRIKANAPAERMGAGEYREDHRACGSNGIAYKCSDIAGSNPAALANLPSTEVLRTAKGRVPMSPRTNAAEMVVCDCLERESEGRSMPAVRTGIDRPALCYFERVAERLGVCGVSGASQMRRLCCCNRRGRTVAPRVKLTITHSFSICLPACVRTSLVDGLELIASDAQERTRLSNTSVTDWRTLAAGKHFPSHLKG